jgi:hypothetical protein
MSSLPCVNTLRGWPIAGKFGEGWKFVFPSGKLSVDPRTAEIRRHHVYENYVTRGVKEAARAARIEKHVDAAMKKGAGAPLGNGVPAFAGTTGT